MLNKYIPTQFLPVAILRLVFMVHLRGRLFSCSFVCNIYCERRFFSSVLFTIPPSRWRLTRHFILTKTARLSICCRRRPAVEPALFWLLIREVSKSHTTTHHSGRTSLDEGPARHRNLYLTTHTTLTTDNRPCPPVGVLPM